jgi:hypothetical protein
MTVKCAGCECEIDADCNDTKVIYRGKIYCCEDCMIISADLGKCEWCGRYFPEAELWRDAISGNCCSYCQEEIAAMALRDLYPRRPAEFYPPLHNGRP